MLATAMALLRHMSLLLAYLLFAGVHVPASRAGPLPPSYDGSMCSESTCGGVEIKYPFYLANYSTSYSCGYTDLKIFCRDDGGGAQTATIQLAQYNYTVKAINYSTSTMLLADADAFPGGNNSCPSHKAHNVTFGLDWLHSTADSDDNLTFFLGCYPDPPGASLPNGLDPYVVCQEVRDEGGTNPGNVVMQHRDSSLVFSSEQLQVAREHDLAESCSQVTVVPVLRNSVNELGNQSMLPREYGSVLKKGFELAWNPITTDPCQLCEQSGGRCSYSQNKAFLGCLCADGKVATRNCSSNSGASITPSTRSRKQKRTKIYIVASVSSVLLCPIILAFFLARKCGYSLVAKNKDSPSIESFLQKNGNMHPKRYTYKEVKRMTKSFSVKLGQGGFGAVYRGNLPDGREVAVKMLKDTKGDGEEFMNEVSSISRTSHVNVVSLLGFCLQGPKRALLYEYMPNGSLERYAFNNNNLSRQNTLTWEKLFQIAIGIARGLEYLHRGCNTRIVHFDIKPHNILLNQDFCPKISDFGLAKLCLNKESAISIAGARGTIGYIAPEVYSKQFGTVSSKSDVYSYGMMVLEMVGARDKKTIVNSESSSQYFPQWIYEHLDDYCISASEINGETSELVRKMIVVGLWCIQVTPTHRPTMTRVVEMLEGNTSTQELPPKMLLMS